jgi:glycosyltransferase involved in cell wall biosynthesis
MMKSLGRVCRLPRGTRRTAPPPAQRNHRVLVVSQATVDGVAVCVRDLVGAAVSAGYDVTVACPSAGPLAAWASDRGADWVRLEMRRSPHPTDILALLRIRWLARSHGLVHLHSSKAGAVGRLATASLGRSRPPVIFTPHGWSWLVGGRLAPVYRQLERTMFALATEVVAVSGEERDVGRAVIGARADRIRVNPNGVDVTRFHPQGPAAGRPSAPLVVCVGRLCHQRAPDLAVAALAMMRHELSHLRLVGDGADRAALRRQVAALGLENRVEFAGFRSESAPDLRAADVVMIPSRYDGMALVLLEAMACGAAIVAARVPGTSALGAAGELVPVDDPASLARAADALMDDPERRRALGAAARERAVEHYSIQSSVGGILALWEHLGARPVSAHPDTAASERNAVAIRKTT